VTHGITGISILSYQVEKGNPDRDDQNHFRPQTLEKDEYFKDFKDIAESKEYKKWLKKQ
jgi:hypothetical protein